MQKVSEIIEQRPGAAFVAFLALHFAAWTALPTLLYPNLPLDLIEALTYGREWQLGHDKLPPLPWWLVEIVYRLFGRDVFYYVLAQVTVLSAFAIVWTMARRLVGALGALVAILIVDGLHYFTFSSPKFNHDVIQLPFWALAGYAYWAALRYGRTVHWMLLGLAVGISFWAKYFAVVLVVPLALFLLFDRDARRVLATPGPYAAALVAAAVIAPHLVWLVQNDFLPLQYAETRAVPLHELTNRILNPLDFVASQLAFLLPTLIIAAPLFFPGQAGKTTPHPTNFDRRIVTLLAFGPMAAVLALSLVTGRGIITMWGYPLWLFLGLWTVMVRAAALDRIRVGSLVRLWAATFSCFAVAFVVAYTVMPAFDRRYRNVFFPGERLGAEISARFRAITGLPLVYVVGAMWSGGNVAHYAPERPRVLIDGDPRRAPWIDLPDLQARGAAVVWIAGDPRTLPQEYGAVAEGAQVQEPFTVRFRRGEARLTVGWAVLPPQPPAAGVKQERE
jgi:4-amino-4-deoxy-L-arabinose transferase-like glycosyltransferase